MEYYGVSCMFHLQDLIFMQFYVILCMYTILWLATMSEKGLDHRKEDYPDPIMAH